MRVPLPGTVRKISDMTRNIDLAVVAGDGIGIEVVEQGSRSSMRCSLARTSR